SNKKISNRLKRVLVGPVLLGYLLNRSKNFLYIWSTGFLISNLDQREYEFKFIKNKNKKIVCYFVGNDIRSPRLMLKFAAKRQIEVISSYDDIVAPEHLTKAYDLTKRRLAEVSETYADRIFNASVDHLSYLKKKTLPSIYFYPDENFLKNDSKFINPSIIKILHSPSSPIIKGTQLVRAAIAKLRSEGYNFKYTELIGVTNEIVLHELKSTHIVLNEFYAFVPGIFGVETMASHCALMTSADEFIEKDLPQGSNNAWFVTKNYQIYDNLKTLLTSQGLIKSYADTGYTWALEHAAFSNSGKKLYKILSEFN
ncbi:MAG: hypothetical protein K8R67_12915, partial [Desulfobacteraceae bacterium]|nr:hypothetical protein [Desulfobacteraceae bacterium]